MDGSLIGLAVFLLTGGLGTAWVFGVLLRHEETAAGIAALAGMHWREFQRLAAGVFEHRGFHRVRDEIDSGRDNALIALRQGREHRLLSTKHGTAYVLNAPAISEFANAMRLHGATGGSIALLGVLAPGSAALAETHRIELLDGRALWAQIRPLLDPSLRADIAAAARRRANRRLLLAWGAAALLGAVVWYLRGGTGPNDAAPDGSVRDVAAVAAPAPAPAATANGHTVATVPDDAQALAERRRKATAAVAALPWVQRALWTTPSTLTVESNSEREADKAAICALLEPYPELRAMRLQLQPPRGSARPVRFVQCKAY